MIISEIVAAHRERWFIIKQQTAANNALGAYVRTVLGWRGDLPEKDRKVIARRATALIAGKAEDGDADLVGALSAVLLAAGESQKPFDRARADLEKRLRKQVTRLPIWSEWASRIMGVGELSVATIIGEAGDLRHYRNESALWSRMGVAVKDGHRQGDKAICKTTDDWIAHGYAPARRAKMFVLGDALVKCTKSPYRAIYLARKDVERAKAEMQGKTVMPAAKIKAADASRCMSDGHIHRRAQRFMETRLLRHMYKAWLRTMPVEKTAGVALGDCTAVAIGAP